MVSCTKRQLTLTFATLASLSFYSMYLHSPIHRKHRINNDIKLEPFGLLRSRYNSLWAWIDSTGFSSSARTLGTPRVMPKVRMSSQARKSLELLKRLHIVESATPNVTSDTKVILWYVSTRHHPVMSDLYRLRTCPESRCRVTTNRFFYNQSDALMFNAQLLVRNPPRKLKNQVWILHSREPPQGWARSLPLYTNAWKSKFNWTFSYRQDADFVSPYGLFNVNSDGSFERSVPLQKNYANIVSTKSGSVAWMVSVCQAMSEREKYVNKLREHGIKVDVIGKCGTEQCNKADDRACLEDISKKYKFYLAFENSFCTDYISEKFFRYVKADLLVIVRGGGNYSRVAPTGTFINTADYLSTRELATYIKQLEANDEKYIELLKVKDQHQAHYEPWPIVKNGIVDYMEYHYEAKSVCELCDRLWNLDRYRKSYNDVGAWYKKGMCYRANDLH